MITINKSRCPLSHSSEVVSALNAALYQFLKGKDCKVFPAPFDVRLDADEKGTHTVVQPDICIICDLTKIDERGYKGAPDLIVKIISPPTARKNLHEKYDLYEQYWIIHPFERTLTTFILQENGSYKHQKTQTEGDMLISHIIEGFKLNLSDIFPDRVEEPVENYNEHRL